jgi:hypothetical protein
VDLLISYIHHSEVQIITALSLISTIHKLPQHSLSLFPACCVFIRRSLATASNSGYSSASRAQVLSVQIVQRGTEKCLPIRCLQTDCITPLFNRLLHSNGCTYTLHSRIGYSDEEVWWISSAPPRKFQDDASVRPRMLPLKSFRINDLCSSLPSDAIVSILKLSLNSSREIYDYIGIAGNLIIWSFIFMTAHSQLTWWVCQTAQP